VRASAATSTAGPGGRAPSVPPSSTSSATAPARSASDAKASPSDRSPRRAMNSEPGTTVRLSSVRSVMRTSAGSPRAAVIGSPSMRSLSSMADIPGGRRTTSGGPV
jgi:hypothetical protein